MKVLIACEFSGVVRRAFEARGHEAWSCDLLPAEDSSPFHLQTNAINIIEAIGSTGFAYDSKYKKPENNPPLQWDLIIGHPPCTYLCNSGVRWLAPAGNLNKPRHIQMQAACDLFAALYWADCPRVAIENPVMHKYARDYLQSAWRVPAFSQSIQPWQFGHGEIKRTCLWTRGLPALIPSKIVSGRVPRVHHASPGKDRWKERSRTLEGIADAMAEQWGSL